MVTKNTILGYTGNTGHSQGDHLHFETLINNKRVDPLCVMPIPAGLELVSSKSTGTCPGSYSDGMTDTIEIEKLNRHCSQWGLTPNFIS